LTFSDLRSPGWWGGIVLALAVAFVAGIAADFVGETLLGFERSPVSDIMMAIIIGMLIANVLPLPAALGGGLKFCASTVLRVGIMLLGVRLSLFGAGKFTLVALPFVIVAIAIGLTTVGTLGRSIGLSRQLSGLIAVGTSICGATAIVATAPLIKAKEAEVSYAIACITVFGLAAMFAYPLIAHALFESRPAMAGLFLGTSIHETAQVAGAGLMYQDQYGAPQALDIATYCRIEYEHPLFDGNKAWRHLHQGLGFREGDAGQRRQLVDWLAAHGLTALAATAGNRVFVPGRLGERAARYRT